MDSIKSQLLDMGFSESKVKRALASCTEAHTLEQVMEWLIAHEDELNSDATEVSKQVVDKKDTNQGEQDDSSTNVQNEGEGSKKSSDDIESRPGETPAQEAARKKITVEEVQKIIAERLVKRADEERKKAIEDEKKRREMGQKFLQTRQELQDQERIRLAQQIRQEKLEKELHRKRVLEQIASDREAMKNKDKPKTESNASKPSSIHSSSSSSKAPSNECKLALRFPDGSSKVQKFSPHEQLSAVRLFVQMEKTCAQVAKIEFVAPPNRKLTDPEMDQTLEGLGLCPASRLEVKYNQSAFVDLD